MWSIEQILALAPDAGSAKSGKELATPRKWSSLGANEQATWGECQGSAKEPYQTQIDLNGPAFKCSCPSRKFPCKHALGLFLLFVSQPGLFSQSTPPTWVSEWLTKRSQRTEESSKPPDPKEVDAEEDARKRREARTHRAAKREERIWEGLEDLELWLQDLVRQGLATVQAKPLNFWDARAARLVDAQAPGLARRVREMASIPASGEGWQGRLLEGLSHIYLAVNGYKNLESLPQAAQDDLRALVGWTQDQDELLKKEGVWDRWLVMGKRVEEETPGTSGRSTTMKIQRTWLWGESTHQSALILSFAAQGQMLDSSLVPGTVIEAELVYFPGSYPLRALVKRRPSAPSSCTSLPGHTSLSAAITAYSAALAANPWIDRFPMALEGVIPYSAGEVWEIRDTEGRSIRLSPGFTLNWQLLSLSGGKPIAIFGEWNGECYWPLSAYADERWIHLSIPGLEK